MRTQALGLLAAMTFGVVGAQATTIGYCLAIGTSCSALPAAATAITASGNTPVQLTGLASVNLAGIGVLWILNPSNSGYDSVISSNLTNINSFVQSGGVLSMHDRFVTGAAGVLPGGGGVAFTSLLGADINIVTTGTLVTNGPGGVITNTTLDGGNFSDHGYASVGSLPAGGVAIFNNGTAGQIVDFYYRFGAGAVYYSSIPLDFYLSGSGNNPPASAMVNTYAPNELAFQASLQTGVPEPASIFLLGGGLLALGFRRLRTGK